MEIAKPGSRPSESTTKFGSDDFQTSARNLSRIITDERPSHVLAWSPTRSEGSKFSAASRISSSVASPPLGAPTHFSIRLCPWTSLHQFCGLLGGVADRSQGCHSLLGRLCFPTFFTNAGPRNRSDQLPRPLSHHGVCSKRGLPGKSEVDRNLDDHRGKMEVLVDVCMWLAHGVMGSFVRQGPIRGHVLDTYV